MVNILFVGIVLVLLSCRDVFAKQNCQFTFRQTATTIYCKGSSITSFPDTGNATTVVIVEADLTGLDFENLTLTSHVENLHIRRSKIRKVGRFKRHEKLLSLDLGNNEITEITPGAFDKLDNLVILNLRGNHIKAFPVFKSFNWYMDTLYVDDNKISKLEEQSMKFIPFIKHLYLGKNNFKIIPNNFFRKESLIEVLDFTNTPIRLIEEHAFDGLINLKNLTLDGTDIDGFPTKGLQKLEVVNLRNVRRLTTIPKNLPRIREIRLAVDKSFLCCRFYAEYFEDRSRPRTIIPLNPSNIWTTTTPTTSTADGQSAAKSRMPNKSEGRNTPEIEIIPPDPSFNPSQPFITPSNDPVVCTPDPTAFEPCENIMGADWLTAVSFVIAPFALCGNFLVIVVFLCSRRHYNVSRFLVTNLAVADLCMGIYLLSLVVESVITAGEYYNHVERFQHGLSCKVLGFLAMFSSELSVFSLTLITIERYLTIIYAMYPKRRLVMKNAVLLMGIGWTVSIVIAILPIFGISSFSKVAICLPFDIENGGKWYLLFVLCFNAICFILITGLYSRIYRSVFLPKNSTATSGHDSRVARRMAVLVFTDFACLAPIAITGLSAMFGKSLVGVRESKYLLVFFFPLNSFMNPFLYALITKSFRRDLAALLKSCFVCGGTLTEYLTTLNNRSLQSNNDHLSRTRQSIDFNTMESVGCAGNNLQVLKENAINAGYSRSEPELVRFSNLSLAPADPKET